MSDLIVPGTKLPSYLSSKEVDRSAGRLADETGVVAPPRLKLLQGNSPEVSDNLGKVGEFYSEAHSASLGLDVVVIPLRWEMEWMEFSSDDEKAAGKPTVKWRTKDPNSPEVLAKGAEAWQYKRLNCLVLAPVTEGASMKMQVLTFHGHSMVGGKQMYLACIRPVVEAPMQAQAFKLSSEDKPGKTPKQRVKAITTRFAGLVNEETYKVAMQAFKESADREITPEIVDDPGSDDPSKAQAVEKGEDLPF